MDILNNLLSIKIKNRIHLIQKGIENPVEYQKKYFTKILSLQKTLFLEKIINLKK